MKIALLALYDHNSLSVRRLHAVLEKNGFNVCSYFLKLAFDISGVIPEVTERESNILMSMLKEYGPDIVGVSIMSTHFQLAAEISKRVKTEINAHVVWGGIHPTLCPGECLDFADSVCIGEGEGAILDLSERISRQADISDIKNLWIKKGDNIIKNDVRPLILNMDEVPFTDFSDKNKYYIENDKVYRHRPTPFYQYIIITMRGCPFECSYCSTSAVKQLYKNEEKYFCRRSVENVIGELKTAVNEFKNLRTIRFWDDIFTLDKNWLKEFTREYKANFKLPFFCYPHPQIIDEETIDMLKDAGLRGVKVGIQNGSDFVRKDIFNRTESAEDIIRLGTLLKKYGISVIYDVITDTPFEDEDDMRKTLELLLKLPKPFKIYLHKLCFYKKSEITRRAIENKLITEDDIIGKQKSIIQQGILPTTIKKYRNKDKVFWFSLYYLTGKKFVPNMIIEYLSRNKFIRRNPYIIAFFKECTYRIYLFVRKFIRTHM
ncbi:B12-binding domain-containing radical SAM protein [Elusimicrobiota bacterium]